MVDRSEAGPRSRLSQALCVCESAVVRAWSLGLLSALLIVGPSLPALALVLDGHEREVEIGLHVDLLEDPNRRWTIEDVAAPPIANHFTRSRTETPNLGLTDSAWWVRFEIENPTAADQSWVLASWWAVADSIELYRPTETGGFEVQRVGESIPRSEWGVRYRAPAFALSLPAGSARTYYLRVVGDDTMLIPLRLYTPDSLARESGEENLIIGVFFGICFVLAVYNLLLYEMLRDSANLYYALWVAFVAAHQFAQLGLFSLYVSPEHPALALRSLHVFGAALILALLFFTRSYLSTREVVPRVDPWLRGLAGAYALLLLLALFGSEAWFVRLMSPVAVVGAVLLVVVGALAWRDGVTHAVYYLAGFALFLGSAIMMGGRAVGLLPSNFVIDQALRISFVLTLLSLSLGLSDRMKRISEKADSEARRAREFEQLKSEADHSNLAKSRVLAAASHDVRQPLHALGLFAQQLRPHLREGTARATLERLEGSLTALGSMLSRLFDMSKIESGTVEPEIENLDLETLFGRFAAEFEDTAKQKGLRLSLEPAGLRAASDITLLGRILQNLIANAIQYTSSGEVCVRARREEGAVRIEVLDSGPGIPRDKERAIFDEFVRLDERGRDGLGLGLSIVKGLAEVLGHEVGLSSSPLGGAAFFVVVPSAEGAGRSVGSSDASPIVSKLGGRLIAVVDDDLAVLEGMRSLIQEWGCDVVVAQDTDDLLEGLETRGRSPDFIIADYRLRDGATGIAAIERVRAQWGEELPALVITGETTREVDGALRARALITLTKPVPPHRLRSLLVEMLRVAA